jgi:hypothetical protein
VKLIHWIADRFSVRGKALSRYRRGMVRARRRDHAGAIEDYTTTIGMPDVPTDVVAMSLYNRALVHIAAGNDAMGVDDLNAVMAMDKSPINIKTMARQKLARTEARSGMGQEKTAAPSV